MADVILVVLNRPDRAGPTLDVAARLAALVGTSRINVLAIREPAHVIGLAADMLIDDTHSVLEAKEREQERMAALESVFSRWAIDTKGAHWVEAEGSVAGIIGERGSRADIIVAGQPAKDDRPGRQAFRAALFGTDRPVLMVPPHPITSLGRCVAIAWRDEKRAARTVVPALRCLAGAEQVHVLVGVRESAEAPVMPRILMEHGIRADLHVLPIGSVPFGKILLDTAHRLSVDLLVMGAYAHSPLRELILGGVTNYMLAHADVPVLMRH